MSGKVCILILNWNNWQDTVECLGSVYESTCPDYEVVVIDNASTDGSVEKITKWIDSRQGAGLAGPDGYVLYDRKQAESGGGSPAAALAAEDGKCVIVRSGGNLGFAGGNNVGIRYAMARGDCGFIWILNNDTTVAPNALSALLDCLRGDPGAGATGSKLLYHHRPGFIQAMGGSTISPLVGNASAVGAGAADNVEPVAQAPLDYVCGASMLVKKDVLDTVGLMDEDCFLYWEDADWGIRMRRAGFGLSYCPASRVLHKEGSSTGYMSALADYYWVRNGLRFTLRFYPWFIPAVMLAYLVKYLVVRPIRRQPLNLGAAASGLWDFIRGRKGQR